MEGGVADLSRIVLQMSQNKATFCSLFLGLAGKSDGIRTDDHISPRIDDGNPEEA
jgi:hypothetical protein